MLHHVDMPCHLAVNLRVESHWEVVIKAQEGKDSHQKLASELGAMISGDVVVHDLHADDMFKDEP
jgi:hypothetical protein